MYSTIEMMKRAIELQRITNRWIDWVKDINECAFTDRMLEDVFDVAKGMKELYDGKENK